MHPGEEGSLHAAGFVFDQEIGVVLVELLLFLFLVLWHHGLTGVGGVECAGRTRT